jgi:hypothetical protein
VGCAIRAWPLTRDEGPTAVELAAEAVAVRVKLTVSLECPAEFIERAAAILRTLINAEGEIK